MPGPEPAPEPAEFEPESPPESEFEPESPPESPAESTVAYGYEPESPVAAEESQQRSLSRGVSAWGFFAEESQQDKDYRVVLEAWQQLLSMGFLLSEQTVMAAKDEFRSGEEAANELTANLLIDRMLG